MMNKRLITLAVAAALTAPAAAMAEATLYGKLNVSIDYQDVTNAIPPTFDTLPTGRVVDDVVDNGDGTITLSGTYATGTDDEGPWTLTTTESVLEENGITPGTLNSVRIIQLDADGNPIVGESGQDYEGWGINGRSSRGYLQGESRANRIGVKGSEDLGNGLKAIYQVEFGVQLADTNANVASGADNVTMRNSFVGLAGGFGTFLVGRHDTPFKISTGKLDLFSDTMADYNGTVGFQDNRTDNTVAYISPSWSGFSFAAAAVAPGGTYFGGQNIDADGFEAYSLAAIYNNGPFYGAVAYESIGKQMYMDGETSAAGDCAPEALSCDYVGDDFNKWRVGLGLLDWNGFTLTAIYEDQDNIPDGQIRTGLATIDADGNINLGSSPLAPEEQQLWQVQAGYAFGNSMFKAMYGSVDRGDARILNATREQTLALNNVGNIRDAFSNDLAGDKSTWAVGFDHNFSKRTKAYVLYTQVDDDNDDNLTGFTGDWEGFSLGMVHSF
jgi:predicted porin